VTSYAAACRPGSAPTAEQRLAVHEPSDDELMDRIQRGDDQAFASLLQRHLDAVHGYLRRLTGSAADAEDLAQDTFLRVWQKAATYQPGKVRVSTWVHRIAHNLAMDMFRRRGLEQVAGAQPELDSLALREAAGPDVHEQAEAGVRLLRALSALPEPQRSAVLLCQVQGFSNREAALIMAVSVRAVESLIARGRRALKRTVLGDES